MPEHVIGATARLAAAPGAVYATIANYHTGHPRIVPKQFSNMVVEQGGIGEGTIIRFDVTVLGTTTKVRASVTEPEPGRVLVERNLSGNDGVTTFTVLPGSTPAESEVRIETKMSVRSGPLGVIERFLLTRILKPMYAAELKLLESAAQHPVQRRSG